jgi:DNA-binding transcriptional ArsR family regulator
MTRPTDGGDADLAAVAGLIGDPTRARVLQALADGRELPASVLAAEAGVSPQAVSTQLRRLVEGGLIIGERSGRHRYFRLASEQVAVVLEALATLAPVRPISSLREDTRAAALRQARTCYDHLAGELGCALSQALLAEHVIVATDGVADTRRRSGDPLSSVLHRHPYEVGPRFEEVLAGLGLDTAALLDGSPRRPLIRVCLDWTEQRHHLGGRLGAALFDGFERQGWVERRRGNRAVRLTEPGRRALRSHLGVGPEARRP